ncbi:hypothetical protein B0H13DRAFT_2343728 [Mycena leptocephala]|nr:hypothetical protein B0H13DRAFT_2343728 [Mycena leptocephala]
MNWRITFLTLLAALSIDLEVGATRIPWAPRRALEPGQPLPSTNAGRLARGLPLLPPRQTGTPRFPAPRSEPSPGVLVTRSCNLRGTNAVTGEFLGYVRTDQNQFGVYGGLQDSPVGALKVALTYSGLMHTALSLKTTNGPSADYPYFGGVVSDTSPAFDIRSDNTLGAFMGGVSDVPAGPAVDSPSTISEANAAFHYSEAAIWSYDATSRVLTPTWTNGDGSSPPETTILYNPGDNTMVLIGKPQDTDYHNAFRLVTLSCADS